MSFFILILSTTLKPTVQRTKALIYKIFKQQRFNHLTYIFVFSLFMILNTGLVFAQTNDDLFDQMGSNSKSNSNGNNENSDSYLSDDTPFTTELDADLKDTDGGDLKALEKPIPRNFEGSRNNFVNDNEITDDVKSLQGPNKKSNSKRVKFIKHPGQKQGLYKISADGKYYYKVEESKQKYGLGIKGGAVVLNQLKNLDTGVSFNDLYGGGAKGAFFLEYYWSYFKDKNVPNILKKARVKFGSGLLLASGTGTFSDPNLVGIDPQESYTFLAFPNHLGLHLSFEFKGKQLIVPFITGAMEYLVGLELQGGNFSRTKFLGQLGAHFGGGFALSLGWLDEAAKFDLDSEFGINQTYLTFELRQNIAIQQDFDFTATFLNVGLQLEF